ncbi:MAG: protein translocase subunit SecF [Candidatus Dadabacteria bacterium]|nr:protein translocase subunit SecF [Candidatus Dadabacteria bacterium]MYA47807.1 protein translocase subunit SecF [Candidatus Dadabacteria bacterium]MYF48059.1 protein translocase subunit SecF [Candidatus Dadabacteria bacterium]MYG83041.1 protein translocase subunit SecF [Candidatus Dadabacteria bacterium]MYK48968.1 protein translocase subunit SecF [Candidatus Dadabacteria bacterium]
MRLIGKLNYDFVEKMGGAMRISIALVVISIASLLYHQGPNWGVEFTGGTEIHIKLAKSLETDVLKGELAESGFPSESVQRFGLPGDNEHLIQFAPELATFDQIQDFQKNLEDLFAESENFQGASIQRIDYIGPRVGKELITKALLSILIACVGILAYLVFRFEFGFAVGAVIALIHDTLITVGAISLADKEFTLAIVAALLTVIGYSVNDTIVIFDRIRENMGNFPEKGFRELVNDGISQTLSRTVLTAITVFIVLVPLFFLGGSVIHDFAFTLMVGVVIGTYSSIFVASAFVVYWRKRKAAR